VQADPPQDAFVGVGTVAPPAQVFKFGIAPAARISGVELLACMGEQERETDWLIKADKLGCQRGADWLVEGLSEVERDADEVISALTRLCIKHALRASASSSSVDADADAAVVAPVDTQPIIVLEEEELDDIVLDFLDHLGDLD
jgi:hypothetical protein